MPPASADPKQYPLKQLKQCWFPGVHSNIGGSYPDTGLADLSLAWMMQQLSPLLAFEPGYALEQARLNTAAVKAAGPPSRPDWGLGKIVDSAAGPLNRLTGTSTRTPAAYRRSDPDTGDPTPLPLRRTHEYIHPSVRVRIAVQGPGLDDKGSYAPAALGKGWHLYAPGEISDGMGNGKGGKGDLWPAEFDGVWKWVNTGAGVGGGPAWIAEETLGEIEMGLLERWPEEKAVLEETRRA